MAQVAKHTFVHETVDTLGAGAEQVADSLSKGALWLCRGLADPCAAEFVQSAARPGITCMSRMLAEAACANGRMLN
jgi:hypothetical protein